MENAIHFFEFTILLSQPFHCFLLSVAFYRWCFGVVQERTYQYPDLTVCLVPGAGCDGEYTEWCASSALENGIIHHAYPISGFLPEGPENLSAVIAEVR